MALQRCFRFGGGEGQSRAWGRPAFSVPSSGRGLARSAQVGFGNGESREGPHAKLC